MSSDAGMVDALRVLIWGLLCAMYDIPVKIMNNDLTGSINILRPMEFSIKFDTVKLGWSIV